MHRSRPCLPDERRAFPQVEASSHENPCFLNTRYVQSAISGCYVRPYSSVRGVQRKEGKQLALLIPSLSRSSFYTSPRFLQWIKGTKGICRIECLSPIAVLAHHWKHIPQIDYKDVCAIMKCDTSLINLKMSETVMEVVWFMLPLYLSLILLLWVSIEA